MDDPPAFRETLKDQSEDSADFVLFALQMPMTQNQGGVGPEKTKFQLGKIQRAHGATTRIILFVTCHHGVPAAKNAVASGKSEIGGMPVALKKCVDVAAIPSFFLGVEDGSNVAASSLGAARHRVAAVTEYRGPSSRPSSVVPVCRLRELGIYSTW